MPAGPPPDVTRSNRAAGDAGSSERLASAARRPAGFLEGFLAALPLWLGVTPFGFVYAAVARRAGLSEAETALMSLLVYAGGAQFTVVRLAAQGSPRHLLVVAAALINLRHVLYGLSLAPYLRPVRHAGRAVAAFFLVDESYGLATREFLAGRGSIHYFLGTGGSLYLAWNLGSVLGTTLTSACSTRGRLGWTWCSH